MGRPPRIDRVAVLRAALSIADESGLAAVTMQAVASRLDVTPMALYRHVADKSAVLDGLVELLLQELPPLDAMPGQADQLRWADQLAAAVTALRGVARRHPAAFPLLLNRPATASAIAVRDAVRNVLRQAGVANEQLPRVERLITTLALGLAVGEVTGRFRELSAQEIDDDFDALRPFVTAAIAPFLATAPDEPAVGG